MAASGARAAACEGRADWVSRSRSRLCLDEQKWRRFARDCATSAMLRAKTFSLNCVGPTPSTSYPELANELVRTKVDVIIAPASTEVEPARQATKIIPIVFAQHADPVGLGHVASLAHPGGNITGVSMVLTELAAKALRILTDTVPHAKQIGVLWNPTTPSHRVVVKEVGAGGPKPGGSAADAAD